MRIAMVHWGYPPIIGGVESHLIQLCPALARMGHEVSLLVGSHPEEPRSEYLENGVHIKRTPLLDLNWLFRRGLEGLEVQVFREIRKFIDESGADIIHAHNMNYFTELHARALGGAARTRHVPLILTAHNAWDDAQFLRLTRDVHWSHIIAVSDYVKMELLGRGIPPRRVTTVRHGIEGARFFDASAEEAYRKYPQLRGRKVVFHPARMGLNKGSSVVMRAFRLVREQVPEAFLVLAGTKNTIDWGLIQQREIAYVLELQELFHLEEHTLIDFFPYEGMPAMYAASDAVLYPSIFQEPFGLVMLEAMASGKPLIVSRAGGMPEVVEDQKTGLIVDPHDHIALARAVVRLFRDETFAREVGERGRSRFRQEYYLERMVDQILSVYGKALERRRRRRL